MSPQEREATDAVRRPLANAQAAIWRHNIDAAIQILFDTMVPELKGVPLSVLHRVIEVLNVITRAADEQLAVTLPQSLKKLALNDVEMFVLSDDVLTEQIVDLDGYVFSDQFVSAPRADEVGPSPGVYRDGYRTIDTILRLFRVYALSCERPEILGLSAEEISDLLQRVEPVLASADPRVFALTRDIASSTN